MKTREEKIQKLENLRFFLAMKDNWTRTDFERDEQLRREIEELKKIKKGVDKKTERAIIKSTKGKGGKQ